MDKMSVEDFRRIPSKSKTSIRAVAESAFAANTAGVAASGGAGVGQGKAKRKAKPKSPTEHEEQVFLMEWADRELFKYPQLSLLFAIPNGAKLPYRRVTNKGVAISHERRKMLKEGMRAGVPDLMMAYPSKGFHGLFIEMKRAEKSLSTVSEAQRDWITNLCANGYRAEICYGWEAARDVILDYLGAK